MKSRRDALLEAFDRLFAKTADKLNIPYTAEQLEEARGQFTERMGKLLEIPERLSFDLLPAGSLEQMETAIDALSPSQAIGQMATVPLIQHSQNLLQHLAYQAAEQRFVDHALGQADTTYGGN